MTSKVNGMPAIMADDILVFNPKTSLSAYANTLSGSFTYPSGQEPCSIMINKGSDIYSYACHAWLDYPESVIYRYKDGRFGIKRCLNTSEIPDRKNVLWAVGGMGLLDFYYPKSEGFTRFTKGGKTYDYSDVLRRTNHTLLGIKNNRCYLIYCSNMTGSEVNNYAKNSGFELAIMLDGGHIAGINGSESYSKINTKQRQGYALQGINSSIGGNKTTTNTKNWIQDAGHGGSDPGAMSNGNVEKDYNLEAALYVNGRLKEHGIDSTCTRTGDITLSNTERTNIVKQYKNCISHHFNAGGGSGTETIHSIHSSPDFANTVIDELRNANYPVRPKAVYSKENSSGGDWYYMHRLTGNCKTTIVEYEFVDGPQTSKIKDSFYRQGMYECTVRAICKYEGVAYKPPRESSKGGSLYRVQVGAFSVKENAEKLKNELEEKGYSTLIKED